jgi:aryl-alcohol dehydrogenase-like predicted oxidoreductase
MAKRDRVLVATKVRGAMGQDFTEGDDHPLQREGLSQRWILRACEDSLRRLQVEASMIQLEGDKIRSDQAYFDRKALDKQLEPG